MTQIKFMLRFALTLTLALAFCQKDETLSGFVDPAFFWQLTELDHAANDVKIVLQIPGKGQILGRGPCTNFQARQLVPYPWFEISSLILTGRTCPELPIESHFMTLLQSMSLVEVAGAFLILTNDQGQNLVFTTQSTDGG